MFLGNYAKWVDVLICILLLWVSQSMGYCVSCIATKNILDTYVWLFFYF